MKKLLYVLSLLIIASMVLTACGGAAPTEAPLPSPTNPLPHPRRLKPPPPPRNPEPLKLQLKSPPPQR